MLRNIDSDNKKKYNEEISILTQQVTIRKRIQQVDEGKIAVDTSHIVTASDDTVIQLYNRFKGLEDIGSDVIKLVDNSYIAALLTNIETVKLEKPRIVFVRDPKFKLFKELFSDIRDRFLFSNEFGLDSNLSVRIRHGTLKGELRRPFSEFRLLTTKNKESGIYYENSFWKNKLVSLDTTTIDHVMVLLSAFSANIDNVISDVLSKWIQVRTENKGKDGVFDFSFSDYDLSLVYLKIVNCSSLEVLMESVLENLWSRTENNLSELRRKLNGELKEVFIYHLNDLEKKLRQYIVPNADYEVQSIFRNISTCRTNIQSDINNVIKWFSISKNKSIIDFTMTELVDTCLQIVRKIYPTVTINVKSTISDFSIYRGKFFESLVIVLLNLLDNACKYGNISDIMTAKLDIALEDKLTTVTIVNPLAADTDVQDLHSIINNIMFNINNDNVSDSLRKEGKTGFYKIHNILVSELRCKDTILGINIDSNSDFIVSLSFTL